MRLISHRGNLNGPNPELENTIDSVDKAIEMGFDCEVDLWVSDGKLFLGHDYPKNEISPKYLFDNASSLFVHAKNQDALLWLHNNRRYINFFSHDKDKFVLTSLGDIWCYPSSIPFEFGINVMPEWNSLTKEDLASVYGICTDFPIKFKNTKVIEL